MLFSRQADAPSREIQVWTLTHFILLTTSPSAQRCRLNRTSDDSAGQMPHREHPAALFFSLSILSLRFSGRVQHPHPPWLFSLIILLSHSYLLSVQSLSLRRRVAVGRASGEVAHRALPLPHQHDDVKGSRESERNSSLDGRRKDTGNAWVIQSNGQSVTLGINWPLRPGYRVLAVFQIVFPCSNLAAASVSFQQSKAEIASEANEICLWILYFRPFYAIFLHSRPSSTVLAQPQLSLNAPVYQPRYAVFGGHFMLRVTQSAARCPMPSGVAMLTQLSALGLLCPFE